MMAILSKAVEKLDAPSLTLSSFSLLPSSFSPSFFSPLPPPSFVAGGVKL
jgi:hypothetical protein